MVFVGTGAEGAEICNFDCGLVCWSVCLDNLGLLEDMGYLELGVTSEAE